MWSLVRMHLGFKKKEWKKKGKREGEREKDRDTERQRQRKEKRRGRRRREKMEERGASGSLEQALTRASGESVCSNAAPGLTPSW